MENQSLEHQVKNIIMENLIKTIENNDKTKYWDFYKVLSNNPNLTMELIEKYSYKPWDWHSISKNPNITMEMIEKYPDKPWDWKAISRNPNLTMEIINKYPDKEWRWDGISRNPNLTIEILKKYINKPLNQSFIFENLFIKEYERQYEIVLKKLQNFNNIEEELIQKTWHPSRFQEWCLDEDQKKDEDEG